MGVTELCAVSLRFTAIIENRSVNFEIHSITLYLVVLVMFARIQQQRIASPWHITLAHEKYINSQLLETSGIANLD